MSRLLWLKIQLVGRHKSKNKIVGLAWCVWPKGGIELSSGAARRIKNDNNKKKGCKVHSNWFDSTAVEANTYLLLPRTCRCQKARGPRSWPKRADEPCLGAYRCSSRMITQTSYAWRATKFQQFILQHVASPSLNEKDQRCLLAESGSGW